MNKEEVLEQIENARRFGREPGRLVSAGMLKKLGNPEAFLPYIHVAGTNGKGSVCTFLERMAMALGKRVGKFTSPHLIRFNERIVVNGREISDEDVTRLGELLLRQDFDKEPTMFDYCLAMALLYFKEQNCDLVILETGLGGRLDSTRALTTDPLACVITRIGFDHMAILGNTLGEIAGEKAGIIRPGVPVICSPQEEGALAAIREGCRRANATAGKTDGARTAESKKATADGKKEEAVFCMVGEGQLQEAESLRLKMLGAYQKENAATALLAMRTVLKHNPAFAKKPATEAETDLRLKAAMEEAVWPGRMECLSRQPFLLVDGAHNSNGVGALAGSLKALYPGQKFHFIMGVMADKDYLLMIEELLPLARDFVTVTPESSRALQGSRLAELIAQRGLPAAFEPDWKRLLTDYLSQRLSPEDGEKWVCFGSLYFIGEVRAFVQADLWKV